MLVLSRKVDETIILDTVDGIVTLTIVAIRGTKIRIGIDAPLTTNIRRGELKERPSDDTRLLRNGTGVCPLEILPVSVSSPGNNDSP